MGGIVVKQPNGLYCRFSTVNDQPTIWNMTKRQYVAYCVKRAKEEAKYEANKVLERHVQPFEQILDSFRPDSNMSAEDFNKILKKMGYDGIWEEEEYDD